MTIEKRQTRLAANAEAREAWMRRLFRAATALRKLEAERKRLLKGPSKKGYTPMEPIGIGGGAIEGLDDEPGF